VISRRLLPLPLIGFLGLLLASLRADQPTKLVDPSAAEDVQDVLFFGPTRPILFRLHLRVHGQPHTRGWSDYLARLFAFLDRDGDGVLDRIEAARAPTVQQLVQQLQGFGLQMPQGEPPFDQLDGNSDGRVTLDEFTRFYRRSPAGPVQLFASYYFSHGTPRDPLTDILFERLDANKDGKLSREELTAAAEVLRKVDVNDDEMITPQELAPGGMSQYGVQVQFGPPSAGTPAMLVAKEEPGNRIIQRLTVAKEVLTRYDRDKNQKLSRAEISLNKDQFESLDTNHDGELDSLELLRWLIVTPDVEITMELAKDKEVMTSWKPGLGRDHFLGPKAIQFSEKYLTLSLDDARVGLVRHPGGGNAPINNNRQGLEEQFRLMDKDDKGYLTRKQLAGPQGAFLLYILNQADRNEDDRLTMAEMNTWFDLVTSAAGNRTTVTFMEQDRGLFPLLDANHDGRLSRRELRSAWQRLAEYDRDGDHCIARTEIPQQFQILVGHGVNAFNPNVANLLNGVVNRPTPSSRGPLWFRKMDINGDGDVSEREFLGSREDFRRIDTDGDGLISVEEAEKADAWMRDKKIKAK
jgi:Ca2+-binding EF-hand superfamily protein